MQVVSFSPPEGAVLVVTGQPAAPMTFRADPAAPGFERWKNKIQAFLAEQWGVEPAAVIVSVQ